MHPSPREAPTTAAKEAALARARAAKAARGKAAGPAKVPLGDVTNGARAKRFSTEGDRGAALVRI